MPSTGLAALPEAMWKRLSGLSEAAKRVLFGCTSSCECDADAVRKMLDAMTDEDIERALAPLSAAAKATEREIAAAAKAEKAAKPAKAGKTAKAAAAAAIPVEDVVQEMAILKSKGSRGCTPLSTGRSSLPR